MSRPVLRTAFCDRVPIFAISDMLGFPRSDRERLKLISDEIVKFIDPISGFDPYDMEAAVRDFRALLGDLIAEREAQPQDDMLSRLLAAEDDGDRLTRAELESMVPHGSQVLKTGEEIPEKHWMYKLAKRFFYNDFGTYQQLDEQNKKH